MTASQIGAAILMAEGIETRKADVQSVSLGIQHSLKNHEGKGVEIVGEARPARWRLKEAANRGGLSYDDERESQPHND
jgi:hypothetical protein